MTPKSGSMQAFRRVLTEDLRQPVYMTSEEVRGAWRDLFPELAACIPAPYPIFGTDEERIITYGYPILISDGVWRLRRELDKQVIIETEYRLASTLEGQTEKEQVMIQRDRYLRAVSSIFENVLMNDYGRGLLEIFLLFHSGDVVRSLSQVAKMAQLSDQAPDRRMIEQFRHSIAAVIGDLIQRAAVSAADSLRQLADGPTSIKMSPLVGTICQDQLLLTDSHPPGDLAQLSGYLKYRLRQDAESLVAACEQALRRLRDLVKRHPEIGSLLSTAGAGRLRLDQPKTLLEPRLLDALTAADLVGSLEFAPAQVQLLRDLGMRLKSLELLAALRRRIRPMERRGSQLVLSGVSSATPIAPSTRPFDFASPGVVESLVRRCGLVYDLTNFTAVLEAVRKEGQSAEEKALQFMYVFQNRLEEIRQRRVLNFEKFLGDGALYSSRRATRVLVAACEIQLLYDHLRHSGFPFDEGIRMALNFGTYRLLPMLGRAGDALRFEFFGHGIVELARLTTGKSTREVDEIAEFLVHAGYNPDQVDDFLEPLMEARKGHRAGGARRYAATIDSHGELINEGIVLTLPFLTELEKEMDTSSYGIVDFDDLAWAAFPVEPRKPDSLYVGVRYLGVARLKGLSPQELAEAFVWEEPPAQLRPDASREPLIDLLRRLTVIETDDVEDSDEEEIGEDLVVVTYLLREGERKWVFGEYRHSDDVVLHAIQVPIQTPELDPDEPMEMWLFRNRFELARLYDGIRREASGQSTPLSALRDLDGYLACFLAAPHRSP
jgi:hypothetical protein